MLRITAISAGSVEYLLRGCGCAEVQHEPGHEHGISTEPEAGVERAGDGPGYFASAVRHGEEPGRWWGSGLGLLGMTEGSLAHEDDVRAAFGRLEHPRTGDSLGRPPRTFKDYQQRLAAALAKEPDATPERRKRIELDAGQSGRKAVAYYDFTFSPVKSVSVLYAALIVTGAHEEAAKLRQAHDDAVKIALGEAEKHGSYVRSGFHGRTAEGRSVGRYERATGFAAITFRHSANRENEPQLHTHGVVINRAETSSDGQIRALDGKGFGPVKQAIANAYERALEQLAGEAVGAVFQWRPDGKAREIVGIDPELCKDSSTRRAQIVEGLQRRVAEYEQRHGHHPDPKALKAIAQEVTLATRRDKSPQQGTATYLEWAEPQMQRVEATLEEFREVKAQVTRNGHPDSATTLDVADRETVIRAGLDRVQRQYATWDLGNLVEAVDAKLGVDAFGCPAAERSARVQELAREALAPDNPYGVVQLSASDPAEVPAALRRADGRSMFRPANDELYATREQLDTEQGIVVGARQLSAPRIAPLGLEQLRAELAADGLNTRQVDAVTGIVGSGRAGDVLVGPAGTGKSHTVGALAQVWEDRLGGRVLGLATSQIAAEVLSDEGLEAINTTVFLQRYRPDANGVTREQVRPGDLYVVDESGMSSTHELGEISKIVADGGGKMLYTGDPAQLTAIGAGGMLDLLVRDNGAFELEEVHRFANDWEKRASLQLRAGDPDAVLEYQRRGRLRGGTVEDVADAAVRGYVTDTVAGLDSLLLCGSNEQAAELSRRIRKELMRLGRVDGERLARLRDDNGVSAGDVVQARRNDYRIRIDGRGMVVNRQTYTVLGRGEGDQLRVQRDDGAIVHLPGSYVAEHLTLAYASTVHAGQGRTVDTGHGLPDEQMQREAGYVLGTRGRVCNTLYLVTEREPDEHTVERLETTPGAALNEILQRQGAQPTAELQRRAGLAEGQSLAWVGGQWDMVSGQYARERYTDVLAGLLPAADMDRLIEDPGYPRLMRAVRGAEMAGHSPASVLTEVLTSAEQPIDQDARSMADVLRYRVLRQLDDRSPEHTVAAGDWTALAAPLNGPVGQFVHELAVLATDRQHELGELAAHQPPRWALEHLGPVPEQGEQRQEWTRRAGVAAAYRELADVPETAVSLGAAPGREQEFHRALWQQAHAALGRPADALEYDMASEADLRAMRERWPREQTWSPAFVEEEMQAAHTAAEDYRREATLAAVQRDQLPADAAGRGWHEEHAAHAQWLAEVYAERAHQLDELYEARGRWAEQAEDARLAHQLAGEELARRGLAVDPARPRPSQQLELFPGKQPDGEPAAAIDAQPGRGVEAAAEVDVELHPVREAEDQLALVDVQPRVQDVVQAQPLRAVSEPDVGEHEQSTVAEARRQVEAAQRLAEQRRAAEAARAEEHARQVAADAERARRDQAELDAQREAEIHRDAQREVDEPDLELTATSSRRNEPTREQSRWRPPDAGPTLER